MLVKCRNKTICLDVYFVFIVIVPWCLTQKYVIYIYVLICMYICYINMPLKSGYFNLIFYIYLFYIFFCFFSKHCYFLKFPIKRMIHSGLWDQRYLVLLRTIHWNPSKEFSSISLFKVQLWKKAN